MQNQSNFVTQAYGYPHSGPPSRQSQYVPPGEQSSNSTMYQYGNSGRNQNNQSYDNSKPFLTEKKSSTQRLGQTLRQHQRRESRKPHGSKLKDHFVAASGEFVGTVLFLWFAFAWHLTIAETTAAGGPTGERAGAQTIMFIAIGYGFSLLVAAWAFYRISGGLFNPAVVLGMVLTGSLPPLRGLFLVPAEILGGMVAAGLVSCMFPGDINTVQTLLSPTTSIVRGLFIEMFLTCLLLFTIHMLAAEKSKVTFIAPLGIGLSLFVAELAGVYYTGGSLNPARSFGPAVAARHFPGYHWIYWVGPGLGSLVTAGYYRFVKYFNYEEANPGQDSADGDFRRDDD